MVETRHGAHTDGVPDEAANKTEHKSKKSDPGGHLSEEKSSKGDNVTTVQATKHNGTNEVKSEPTDDKPTTSAGDKHKPPDRSLSPEDGRKRQKTENSGNNVKPEEDAASDDTAPAILERGKIYFFFRARVNIDEPHSLDDVARTYIVLQPQTKERNDSGDSGGHCRLLALPKKVLPRTGRDRYMAFVLKADASYSELESEFLSGSQQDEQDEQEKKEQNFPPATVFGEGVYSIIGTGRESHLAYVLTVPKQPGAVQEQLGLAHKQGCFIISTKNPAYPMPGGSKMVGGGPDYPKDIKESFRLLRWAPLRPEHLNYVNSHLLLVGESKGAERIFSDDHGGRELSAELEELADDDLDRMRRLGSTETEAVFASLHAKEQAEGQPELTETFG